MDAIVLVYFIPAGVALLRKHPQFVAIAVLNLLLGWTIIGWILALVWACTTTQKPNGAAPSQFHA